MLEVSTPYSTFCSGYVTDYFDGHIWTASHGLPITRPAHCWQAFLHSLESVENTNVYPRVLTRWKSMSGNVRE